MSREIPNRFDFAEAMPRLYRLWEDNGYFAADPTTRKKPFTIVIPPPNVTGALHLGHALNNTLQDIVIRRKRMQGFSALWMPGTDHAGIGTQAVVEKRLREEEGKSRHDLGRDKLVERIWQWKDAYEARILGQLKRMGCSCDWRRTRFTLDAVCARAVRQAYFNLFRQGYIYRGKRLVNWDTFLQTAVSDDEVNNETVQGHFWHLRYPVIDPRPGEPAFVVVATTRPETMLGDVAVAVHPNPGKALQEHIADLQRRRADASASERQSLDGEIEQARVRTRDLLPSLQRLCDMAAGGRHVRLPLINREIPLILDAWAKPQLGSGCVKITPAHDPNDYEVGRRHRLPMVGVMNYDGTLNAKAGPYQGLSVPLARKKVVADLEALDLIESVEARDIELPFSDRSKTPIEPLLADQWFVRMDRLAETAMQAVTSGAVTITPSRYAKSYLDWLGEKRDWPISRQLWWGHQIPVWSRPVADETELRSLEAELCEGLKINGTESAYIVEPADPDDPAAAEPAGTSAAARPRRWATVHVSILREGDPLERLIESQGFVREPDVLDTWFSSSLWPFSTMGWPAQSPELDYFYPTDLLITSRDIISLWVARMVLMARSNTGQVPFRQVYIHPKILDAYGETMSKSKGNGVDPIDVIDKFGADALRFGLAYLCTETQDVRMPVQFECPHCQALIEQTRKNRELPRIACTACGKPFATQWASQPGDVALPRGAVVSQRFELARNFGNKLWNASRFALLNLDGYAPGPIADAELLLEDRWMLSRLATVGQAVDGAVDQFRFADAARAIYDFAWDEFCSFYLEILKDRLADPARRPAAQRLLAHALDTLLRLLHPLMPFMTEEIWQMLNRAAPQRGMPRPIDAPPDLIVAPWPIPDAGRRDAEMELMFSRFQGALGAIRDLRAKQNLAGDRSIEFLIRCPPDLAAVLDPLRPYFASMANARCTGLGPDLPSPPTHAMMALPDMEIVVDLAGLIDVEAERQRLTKEKGRLTDMILGKENKLSNEAFVSRAPVDVVQRERDNLAQLREQLHATERALNALG